MKQVIAGELTADVQLALDETMLLMAESGEIGPTMRVWAFDRPTVVLGRASKVNEETDRAYCDANGVSIYRRCSGGASIVGGPGCLMYSIVLSLEDHPDARKVDLAHELVMPRVRAAVAQQLPETKLQGICDLTWRGRKFSGNALRITRGHLLYHGTILHDADLKMIARCLAFAPRQPEYREGREHQDFITNASLDPAILESDLVQAFGVEGFQDSQPLIEKALQLAQDRYSQKAWRFRH